MSVDREQVRRDAENRYGNPWARIARYEELVEHLDSELEQVKRKCLISETNYGYASDRLEQAERERDGWKVAAELELGRALLAEAQLVVVPALVEAGDDLVPLARTQCRWSLVDAWSKAIAKWEQAQGEKP